MNHLFDTGTPTGGTTSGGAPAPPRDDREDISDLLDCFDFRAAAPGQAPAG